MKFNPGTNRLIDVDGFLVEEDALRVAEKIKEYDPDLEILCLKPEMAGAGEEPFQICHKDSSGVLRKIFGCWELNDMVLERIRLSDGHRVNTIDVLNNMEAQIKKDRDSRYRDLLDEKKDLVDHIAANRRNVYTFRDEVTGDLVKVYDDRPSERA